MVFQYRMQDGKLHVYGMFQTLSLQSCKSLPNFQNANVTVNFSFLFAVCLLLIVNSAPSCHHFSAISILLKFTLTGPPLCALLSHGYFVLFNGIPTSAAIRTSCASARPALQVFTSQKHCMQYTFQYFLYSFLFVGMLSFHQLMCGSAAIISFTIQDKISIDIAVPDYQTQLQLKVMCT